MAKKAKENKENIGFALARENYYLLAVGFAIIVIGFILMVGGGSKDPHVFVAENELTEASFAEMKNDGLPEEIIASLEPLKNKRYGSEEAFLSAVGEQIDAEKLEHYKYHILKSVEQYPAMFNFRRITLAPILVLFGFVFEIFAIMKKPKQPAIA